MKERAREIDRETERERGSLRERQRDWQRSRKKDKNGREVGRKIKIAEMKEADRNEGKKIQNNGDEMEKMQIKREKRSGLRQILIV